MHRLSILLGMPKSFYLCLVSMPLKQALKLPIWVSANTQFRSLSGKIEFLDKVKPGMVRIGLGGAGTALHLPSVIENNGIIIFGSGVSIGGGCQICTVQKTSRLQFDRDVKITSESHIAASKEIQIGKGCIISWNTQIMDTDYHNILSGVKVINEDQSIKIGSHVWIGSRVSVLKGSEIANDIIIASGSIISGKLGDEKSIYVGLPVRKLRENVEWGPRYFDV